MYVNNQIKAPFMILVNSKGEQLWKFPRKKVVEISQIKWLDIIQLHYDFNEKVATVRLVDLGKYLYEAQKATKEKKKTQKKQWMKQIKFWYSIGDNDLAMKISKIREFLWEGYSVKVSVRLKGRERMYANIAKQKLMNIQNDLQDVGRWQFSHPKGEWHNYVIILLPKHTR